VCSIPALGQRAVRRGAPAKPAPEERSTATGQTLPIKRVILYSNGVAYIERRGTVSGHAEVNLSFKQSQVDDVLKSMVVLDLGQGRIGAVSYNSSAPPSARMADIPFSIAAQTAENTRGGLAGVLSQLQGARVVVTTTKGTFTGSVLTIEQRKSPPATDKPATTIDALVIATESGELSSFDLTDVRSVRLVDEGTRRDVSEFASAAASARRRDAKTITVTSDGSGQREMVVSYTVAAPIWKTTYRVVLDPAGTPFFQGWAIVDNVSDEDWNNVQLSLVSGTPISFIQPIQQPFYRYRPVVPIPSDLKLDPQTYEPDVEQSGSSINSPGGSMGSTITNRQIAELPLNNRASSQIQISPSAALNNNFAINGADSNEASVSSTISGGNSGVETAATGSEIGDLFEYRIDQPVTVHRDRSALIPIVQSKMEGERISIYNQATRADRALGGLLLRNTSALTLEGGSMTVLDRDAYAGEALMERLKPNEQRVISFALDLGTIVTTKQNANRAPAYRIRAVNGVFQTYYFQTDQRTYTFKNQTDRPRVIYVEHPVRAGWELDKNTPAPAFTTGRYYRFRLELPPYEKRDLVVTERHALLETYDLDDITREEIDLFIAQRYIDEPTHRALENLLDIKVKIDGADQQIAAIDKEVREIGEDQARLRENIKALAQTAEARQLIARYVAKARISPDDYHALIGNADWTQKILGA
ncbi:MAG: hypothetical protein ABIZ95_20620, partial [Pyrinomonadaceae bacterium]